MALAYAKFEASVFTEPGLKPESPEIQNLRPEKS